MTLQFLAVDGNSREARDRREARFGEAAGMPFVRLLRGIEPEAVCAMLPAADGDLGPEVLDPARRTREIRGSIGHCSKPTEGAHGRA